MLLNVKKIAGVSLAALALGSCGFGGAKKLPKPVSAPITYPANQVVKIGEPYQVNGVTYVPADDVRYDEVGYASWYGAELAGNPTSNGESFNPAGISAAHPTLPMPSFVEVTHLGTGKTILVRVNDRGPYIPGRIVDLSQGAVQQLGAEADGTFPVRVRRVSPSEQEKGLLSMGKRAGDRYDTPQALLVALRKKLTNMPAPVPSMTPKPAPLPPSTPGASYGTGNNGGFIVEDGSAPRPRPTTTAPAPSSGGIYVQIGAFGSKERADAMASRAGAKVFAAGSVYRVRTGPYRTEAEAQAALAKMQSGGFADAKIVH